MESSRRNHQPTNGMFVDFHRWPVPGITLNATPAVDVNRSSGSVDGKMNSVIDALAEVERFCENLIVQLEEPVTTCNSEVSQCSGEYVKLAEDSRSGKRKNERCAPPPNFIDLTSTSEDSSDSDSIISRRVDRKSPDIQLVQNRVAQPVEQVQCANLQPVEQVQWDLQFAEQVQTADSELDQSPEVEQGRPPEVEQGRSPEVDQGRSSEVEQGRSPEVEQGRSPDVEQGQSPDGEQHQSPDLEPGQSPDVEQVQSPDLEPGQSPDLVQVEQVQSPDLEPSQSPDLEQVPTPDLDPVESPAAIRSVESTDTDLLSPPFSPRATGSSLKRKQHPSGEVTILSDDDSDTPYQAYSWQEATVAYTQTQENGDALRHVWDQMASAFTEAGLKIPNAVGEGHASGRTKRVKVTNSKSPRFIEISPLNTKSPNIVEKGLPNRPFSKLSENGVQNSASRKVSDNGLQNNKSSTFIEHTIQDTKSKSLKETESSLHRSSIQLAPDVNALVPVEKEPVLKVPKRRGRPRKDAGITPKPVIQKGGPSETRPLKSPSGVKSRSLKEGKEGGHSTVCAVKSPREGKVKIPKESKDKKADKKHEKIEQVLQKGSSRKGKATGTADEYDADTEIEDDEDEEEECGKFKKSAQDLEELNILSSKLNGEKVDYEPYRWRKQVESDDDEDEELQHLFNERQIALASTQAPTHGDTVPARVPPAKILPVTIPQEDENSDDEDAVDDMCLHANFDFDEDVGYYCEDCGSIEIDLPTSKPIAKPKPCKHKNTEFDDDVGYYCLDCGYIRKDLSETNEDAHNAKKPCQHKSKEFSDEVGLFCSDCGRVGRDIQNIYMMSEAPKSSRKQQQIKKDGGGAVEAQEFFLKLQESGTEEFCGSELEIHPLLAEKLHPHQKKGFTFLAQNLLGDKKRPHESFGCVLAHAPGTGKTFLMISFIQSFLARYPQGRPLIIAPKIILNSWLKEFENWKVQEIPIFNLNDSRVSGEVLLTGDEDEEEVYAKLPSHLNKSLKEGRAKVLEEWQGARGVLLVSYTLFSILVSQGVAEDVQKGSAEYQIAKVLLEAPNLVVLDEGHLARNVKTKISQALLAMETRRRVLLSGTLFQNNFKELYTLLKLCRDDFMISHDVYGSQVADACAHISHMHGSKYSGIISFAEKRSKKELMGVEEKIFQEEIGDKLERYVKSGESRIDEIQHVVKKLQSLTESFVDWYPGEILKSLPGLFEYSVHLNLTAVQQLEIQRLAQTEHSKYHMSRQVRLLAACIHPCLVNRGEDVNASFADLDAATPLTLEQEAFKGVKITFISQLVARCQAAHEKLLIFCSTLNPLKYIEDLFCKQWNWQKGREILRLDGTMQENDRQKVIEQFNKENRSFVLLASTKACKEGITLVGASRVVIIDNLDNPAVIRQAVSRAFRIGQKKKVFVYRLVTTSPEEEDIFRRSVNKERLSQVLLDPISTMARMGSFLQEVQASEVEDELLRRMIKDDERNGRLINMINRYNAVG